MPSRRVLITFGVALAAAMLPASARAADARAFAHQVALRYHVDQRHVVTADVDRDGDLDVVASTDRGFFVWLNDGAGRFISQTAKHRPLLDGGDGPQTWNPSQPAQLESIPGSGPPLRGTPDRAHAPPPQRSRFAVRADDSSYAGRCDDSSTPRAPPAAV